MIKLIGIKRVIILILMAMANLVLAAIFFLWITPSSIKAEQELNVLTRDISKLQGKILNVKKTLEETQAKMPAFNLLETRGLFEEQNRFRAERIIQDIRAESGVKAASFSIGALQYVPDENAQAADYRLVFSTIDVDGIRAYTDIEIYELLYLLNHSFPGHVRFKSLEVKREGKLTEDKLLELSDPENPHYFVRGNARFQWFSLVKNPTEATPEIGGGL